MTRTLWNRIARLEQRRAAARVPSKCGVLIAEPGELVTDAAARAEREGWAAVLVVPHPMARAEWEAAAIGDNAERVVRQAEFVAPFVRDSRPAPQDSVEATIEAVRPQKPKLQPVRSSAMVPITRQ